MAEPLNIREQHRHERLARVARYKPPAVMVEPRTDAIRQYIRHMPSGRGFPATGPAVWPLDRFTQRRIADGDVRVVSGNSNSR